MSKTIVTAEGDTFATLSRKAYGSEQGERAIRAANPGAIEPFRAGLTIRAPALPGRPTDLPQSAPATNEDEVAVIIDGKRFRFWDSVDITRTLDSVSTVEFSAPYDPDNADHRETFKPFSYKDVTVLMGGEPLFAGTMVAVRPLSTESSRTVAASCYSKPGVLMDCTAPASLFPLEYNELTLQEIAQNLLAPFGLGLEYKAAATARLERVAVNPGERVWSFLSALAGQQNALLRTDEVGNLVIDTPRPQGAPVAEFIQGQNGPVLSVEPFFNEQDYYSDVTGLEPVMVGDAGSIHTVKNARLSNITRPYTYTAQDADAGSLPEAVATKAGRMFGNMVSYRVTLSAARNPDGQLWQPGQLIALTWPDAMIFNRTELMIRDVVISATDTRRTATLTVVLPGAFSGEQPEVMPWD